MDESDKRPDRDRRIALDARDWIVRLASGDAGEADLRAFKAWRDAAPEHGLAFERERRFWQELQVLEGALARPAAEVRARPAVSRRGFVVGGALAAGAAGVILMPRLERLWQADFTTAVGEQKEVALPDGSVATLNTDSAIAVDFRPDLRLVRLLGGEAVFKVKPGASVPFRVASLDGNSDALDAQFSVNAVDGVATVTVANGRAHVSAPAAATAASLRDGGGVELRDDEQTSYSAGRPPRPAMAVDSGAVLAWRSGRVIFEGRPFSSAVAELGRYVPERIVLGPTVASDLPVSAIFSTREALSAVQALAKTQGLTARRIPGVAIIIA
ncbi:MAG TPA: FecR domain-containing protein [Bosea sp. (in: a-proteobacteria)]|jgi:transmembrane sensor|uniref:FecR family protein n=1 Tax=Bosea sp. (in: a-proteobacteria) TaxID=1871050 RepID=UPI002E146F9A|nr:FecR domain-containing protein [Bosea sp. (in: a-proteobacteria)]